MKYRIAAGILIGTIATSGQSFAQTIAQPTSIDSKPVEVKKEIIIRWELLPASGTYTVLKHSNLRSGPGIDHSIIGKLKPNTQVEIIGKVDGKNWVLLEAGNNVPGYVHASLINEVENTEYFASAIDSKWTDETIVTVPQHTEFGSIANSTSSAPTMQSAINLNERPMEKRDELPPKFQLGFLHIGMSHKAARNTLRDRFYKVEGYDSGVYTIIAGNEACFVTGIQYLAREQHESELLNQLVDGRFLQSTHAVDKQSNECIAVEILNSRVSGITHFSIHTNVSDGAITSALLSKFGTPAYNQTSLNAAERFMGWRSNEGIDDQELLSASVLYIGTPNSGPAIDNVVLTRVNLQTTF